MGLISIEYRLLGALPWVSDLGLVLPPVALGAAGHADDAGAAHFEHMVGRHDFEEAVYLRGLARELYYHAAGRKVNNLGAVNFNDVFDEGDVLLIEEPMLAI